MRKHLSLALLLFTQISYADISPLIDEYWTRSISDEYPSEVRCRDGYVVVGASCQGSYCDNVSLLCRYAGSTAYSHWSNWFSEEQGGEASRYNHVTGLRCRGSYCDDLQLQYSRGPRKTGHCYDTIEISEETRPAMCRDGYSVSGMYCTGRYCDNISLNCCSY